jgi:hypothetical protein
MVAKICYRCFKNKLCISRRAGLIHRLGSLFKACLLKVVIAENNIGPCQHFGESGQNSQSYIACSQEEWETIAELGGYQD